jgi:hypothetical protein
MKKATTSTTAIPAIATVLRLMPQRVATWGVKFYLRERPSGFDGAVLGIDAPCGNRRSHDDRDSAYNRENGVWRGVAAEDGFSTGRETHHPRNELQQQSINENGDSNEDSHYRQEGSDERENGPTVSHLVDLSLNFNSRLSVRVLLYNHLVCQI